MGKIFQNLDLNSNELERVGKIELLEDASQSTDAVRLSQAQSIATQSTQDILVANSAAASETTSYTSSYVKDQLNTKQDIISIKADSAQYLSFDGNKIGIKNLTVGKVYKDVTNTSLAEFIASATFNGDGTLTIGGEVLDARTVIFLINASS